MINNKTNPDIEKHAIELGHSLAKIMQSEKYSDYSYDEVMDILEQACDLGVLEILNEKIKAAKEKEKEKESHIER